jgi:hypothetical protein
MVKRPRASIATRLKLVISSNNLPLFPLPKTRMSNRSGRGMGVTMYDCAQSLSFAFEKMLRFSDLASVW